MRSPHIGNSRCKLKTTIAILILGWFGSNNSIQAQVVSDGTTNSQVNTTENISTITGGKRSGNNLFHSFEGFSVPTNTTAYFDNLAEIQHIFSRVTGGSISKIDGTIKTNGSADLFILNPAGIIFGANARLDVGGSFIATTSESLVFGDGTEFDAVSPQAEPLLTVTAPVGLQYGRASNSIVILNNDNRPSSALPVGLSIKPNNTLALLANNISIVRNDLNAFGGSVELGSVNLGTIDLQNNGSNWQFGYEGVLKFGQIDLARTRIISNGTINLRGKDINLSKGSGINNFTQTDGEGGIVNITASNAISLNSSSVFTQVGQKNHY